MVSTNLFSTYLINTLNGTVTNYPAAVNMREGTNWWKVSTKKLGTSTWYTSSVAMFVVDRTGPSIPVLTSPASGLLTNNATPLFVWSASSDATTYVGSGVARYEIQFGTNIAFSGVSKTTNATGLSVSVGPLADGAWYWRVRAVDNVSNRGAWSAVNSLTVDATAPLAPTAYFPLNGKWTNGNPRFYWSRPTGGSPVTNFTLEISSNIGFSPINTTVNQSGTNYIRIPALSAGNWYWRVRARDAAGNTGPNSGVANVNIDLTPPAASNPSPADGSYSATTNVTFTWTGTDPIPFNSGISNYTILLRTNSLSPFFVLKTTNQAQFTRVFKHDGTNWWRIKTRDRAGNTNTSVAWSIIVDTSVPVATLHYPVNIFTTNNRPQFSWSAATGGDTNRLQVSVNNFGGTTIDIRQLGTNYPPLIDLAEGTNKWRVLTHKIGTTTWYTSAQAWVFVDTLPPNFTVLAGPQNNAVNVYTNYADFRWKAVDAGVGVTNYTIEITTNWAGPVISITLLSTNFSTNLFNANWKWRVLARDRLGHVRISATNVFVMQSFNASVAGSIRGSDDIHQVDMNGSTGYAEKLAGNIGVTLVFSLTGTVSSGSAVKVIWQANGQPVQGVNEIPAIWNGSAWVAKIPASAIKDYAGQIIYYQIVVDNRLIANSGVGVNYASWGFTAGLVTEQKNGVTVLNNVMEKGVGSVSIVYKVETEAKVQIMVYNINGELVRELVNMTQPADVHVVRWDGKNIKGEEVGRGVYFISVRINSGKETRKVMVK
jgi:flagellar hook assembly protein FlgD